MLCEEGEPLAWAGVDGLACDARREPLPSCRRVCAAACDDLCKPLQPPSHTPTIISDPILHPPVKQRRSAMSQAEAEEEKVSISSAMFRYAAVCVRLRQRREESLYEILAGYGLREKREDIAEEMTECAGS